MKTKTVERYLEINRYVGSLHNVTVDGQPRVIDRKSIFLLLRHYLADFFAIRHYFAELRSSMACLNALRKLKNSQAACDCLLIGNGPSQDYLTPSALKRFQDNSFQIIVINYWNENTKFSGIVPNFILISDPDILHINAPQRLKRRNDLLNDYLTENQEIKIICPTKRYKDLSAKFASDRLVAFTDTEMSYLTNNTSPLLPRGYVSMTLYKALAVAKWFNYRNICIIGIDNTYPRCLFSNDRNHVLQLEEHAGTGDYTANITSVFPTIADALISYADLFRDIHLFKANNIYNLDPYSLTDCFTKISFTKSPSSISIGSDYVDSVIEFIESSNE